MQHTKATIAAAALLAAPALAGCPKSCPVNYNTPVSCRNTTVQSDSCCFENYLLLATQFWDTNPASGPQNVWTVHGALWSDYCDGTYPQYCDESRQYKNITQILESYNQIPLLTEMRELYTDYHGQEESFWEHEWGKHGTCFSTLRPSCYSNYSPQEEVVDYFQKGVATYNTLDTFAFLAAAGIVPTTSKNYTYTEVTNALQRARGVTASPQCNSQGELDEVWYSYLLKGSYQTGQLIPTNSISSSSCPSSFKYLPKNESTAYPVSSVTSSAMPTATFNQACRVPGH